MDSTLEILPSCIGCGRCVSVCIRGHLTIGDDRKVHETDSAFGCFRCGHCAAICPKSAIVPRWYVSEVKDISGSPIGKDDLRRLLSERRSIRWFDRNCTREEISEILEAVCYSPTAENSQSVEYAVVEERFDEFMVLLASILSSHTDEHPRLKQFVDYVNDGQQSRNNPFTWEGRQIIIAFSRLPIDAIIAMEQVDLMASAMGLGGFHSRWMLKAAEDDMERFMSFFPGIRDDLHPYAVYVIGHPRVRFKHTVERDERPIHWM